MANQLAIDIVQTALQLRAQHPDATALEIMDMAMLGRGDSSPVFDLSDEGQRTTDGTGKTVEEIMAEPYASDMAAPNGEFGKLLEAAFSRHGAPYEDWDQEIMVPFAMRYRLWSNRVNLHPAAWRYRCFAALMQSTPPARDVPEDYDGPPIMDEFDVVEGLEMLALELYQSPNADGLSPEAAAAAGSKLLG